MIQRGGETMPYGYRYGYGYPQYGYGYGYGYGYRYPRYGRNYLDFLALTAFFLLV